MRNKLTGIAFWIATGIIIYITITSWSSFSLLRNILGAVFTATILAGTILWTIPSKKQKRKGGLTN